ncbi:uncharacterized protein F4812DRAFT_440118 [Daldinia caldariorum]|uniref:uncharacterized protein n=1 Tax=Daldinia caldariorum TaxID=326644 RepID=UPI002007E60E|nr:uncharacterized protein F4812DRAFT_440118 [Daldinia caldariorum]KAI1465210.1 hypothetical protein F4812DRAFT_440118 [Daldinia caldariorum]
MAIQICYRNTSKQATDIYQVSNPSFFWRANGLIFRELPIPQAGCGANSAKWSLATLGIPSEFVPVLKSSLFRALAAFMCEGPLEGQVHVMMGLGLFVAWSILKQADLVSDGSLRFVSGLQAHHRILPLSQSGAIYICTMLVYPLVLMHSRTHTVRTHMYVCTLSPAITADESIEVLRSRRSYMKHRNTTCFRG